MTMLSVRLIVTVALVTFALAPGIDQPWQDSAVVALGAGLMTVLIKDFRARQSDRSTAGR